MPSSDSLRDALVQRAWAQWIALGVSAVGTAEPDVIDPEALVVLTAELGDSDARLRDTSIDWCIAYGRFISAARLRSVLNEMGGAPQAIGEYSGTVAAGGGPRWPMATDPRPAYRRRGKARLEHLDPTPRVLLRFRAAFGVNARADVAALALRPGVALTLSDLARITRFTKRNVAFTVDSLALAGLVELESFGNERRASLRRDSLQAWLPPRSAEPVEWIDRLAVCLATLRFLETEQPAKPGVRSVEARVFVRDFEAQMRRAKLPRPDTRKVGHAFRDEFSEWLVRLSMAIGTGAAAAQ